MTIDIDEGKVNRNESALLFGWILATGLGMLLGFLPAGLIADTLGLGVARVLTPILAGILIGVGQWLVLRYFITKCSDWILAAGAGWAIGFSLGILIVNLLPGGAWLNIFGYILFGFVVALVQWPILRREIPQSLPWIIANIAGWTLAFFVGQMIANLIFQNFQISSFTYSIISNTIAGLIAGAVIGMVLIYIVRKPDRQVV